MSHQLCYDVRHLTKSDQALSGDEADQIADFLVTHLGEYGDPKEDVLKSIAYAHEHGGVLVTASQDGALAGVCLTNETNMTGFVPENLLVYIAVDETTRGQGVGSDILDHVREATHGDIALHVDPDNPARKLYERKGFENPYLEMRLTD